MPVCPAPARPMARWESCRQLFMTCARRDTRTAPCAIRSYMAVTQTGISSDEEDTAFDRGVAAGRSDTGRESGAAGPGSGRVCAGADDRDSRLAAISGAAERELAYRLGRCRLSLEHRTQRESRDVSQRG